MLDEVKARGQVAEEDFPKVFGRISFFVNAGVRFIEEHAKLRAMGALWEEIGRERYGVTDEKLLRMRYGVQVNSLGLTEAQPENNVQRIVLEALAVTLGRNARARAIQLPAWNEAMGLPRPWDQQWSLRIQQVLAFETDLLDYPDIFEGSKVMDGLVAELTEGAREEMAIVDEQGGAVEAVPYMKARLVESHRERRAKIESGEIKMVGQNSFTETEDSPLTAGADGGILVADPEVERERLEALERVEGRARRGGRRARPRPSLPRSPRDETRNIMPATIAAAKAGATTGEWAGVLRDVFGDYRAPTGVGGAAGGADEEALVAVRERVEEVSEALGHRLRILVGKPGLDGHSNGAEQIAVRARDVGMEVIYQGIRLTPEQIAASAIDEDVDVVGLSILSGSHRELVPETVRLLREQGVDVPVVVGGIIPAADASAHERAGVARVYTPKDFEINRIMGEIVDLVAERNGIARAGGRCGPLPGLSRGPIEFPEEGLSDGGVRLRLLAEADVAATRRGRRTSPEIARFTTMPSPYTEAEARSGSRRRAAGLRAGTDLHPLIVDADPTSCSAAAASLSAPGDERIWGIGYWVAAAAPRQRLRRRAPCGCSTPFAFDELAIERLELLAEAVNPGSTRTAEACGFTREGVLRSYLEIAGERRDMVMLLAASRRSWMSAVAVRSMALSLLAAEIAEASEARATLVG